jgi:prophage regulatory protein
MVNRSVLLRRPSVEQQTGKCRSSLYADIKRQVFPPPIKIGPQAVAWPANEVESVVRARIAGKTEEAIKALVLALIAERGTTDA